jgi:hypothetical protein
MESHIISEIVPKEFTIWAKFAIGCTSMPVYVPPAIDNG